MSRNNCKTDTDANRTVSRKPVKVMSEQERGAEFMRIMTQPKFDALAQAKFEHYLELLQKWEAGYTDEVLDGMAEDDYSSHQSRLSIQAGFTDSSESLEAWMFYMLKNGIGKVRIIDTRYEDSPFPEPSDGNC